MQLANGLLVATRLKQNPSKNIARARKGIEFPATLRPGDSLIGTTPAQQP